MLSLRLQAIADMIPKDSKVIDIGCDHGLLDVFLAKYKNCTCIASDITEKCLQKAKDNALKYQVLDKVSFMLSDGLSSISFDKESYVVIDGMGTSTILNVLKDYSLEHIIIQSNNEIFKLRKELLRDYCVLEETVVYEKNIDYVLMHLIKGKSHYSFSDYLLGPIIKNDVQFLEYRKRLLCSWSSIYKRIPKKYIFKRLNLCIKMNTLKKYC